MYGASGPLMLLGTFPIDSDAGPWDIYYNGLDQLLEGWTDHCGPPDGLAWLIGKMAQPDPDDTHTHLFGRRDENGAETPYAAPRMEKSCFPTSLTGPREGLSHARPAWSFRTSQKQPPERKSRWAASPGGCICVHDAPPARAKSAEEARNSQT